MITTKVSIYSTEPIKMELVSHDNYHCWVKIGEDVTIYVLREHVETMKAAVNAWNETAGQGGDGERA